MNAIGRFAPSPSGRMHLGNIFTALLAWLSVRTQGGEMVLRVEDLDTDRCKQEYADQLKDDLRWLGLDWDREQPAQSGQTAAYASIFEQLQVKNLVYPCYCSRADLHAASAPHAADGRILYAGTCRDLTDTQRATQTKHPAWRLRVPDANYGFNDGLQGPFSENLAHDCGDFILRRADGVYAYQLAVVADDLAGGVTEVVRGLDLLESTPRQLYLYELLGGKPPRFYHTPLLLALDGRRLSKRERDLDMGALRQHLHPEELTGFLAFLAGLVPKDCAAAPVDLICHFSWNRVRREAITVPELPRKP